MPQRPAQPESSWIQLVAPVNPSRKRLWVLSVLLAGWICFMLAMFCLTVVRSESYRISRFTSLLVTAVFTA